MARFVVGKDTAVDMHNLDIGGFAIVDSDIVTADDDSCTVESEDGFDQLYQGTGFDDFDPETGVPTTGTITSWNQSSNGLDVFTLTDFSQTWEDYWGFVNSGDTNAYLDAVFSGADTVIGGNKDDSLIGGNGNDTIKGGKGNDYLLGGNGRDTIIGGAGHDVQEGGAKSDLFVYQKLSDSVVGLDRDVIADFRQSQGDKIDLHKIDADTTTDGNQAFHLGGSEFSETAGELIKFHDAFNTLLLRGDVDGDGVADFEIQINGNPTLVDGDFIF